MVRFKLMKKNWKKFIISNFDEASVKYNQSAHLQQTFANKLAKYCTNQFIPNGPWIDLGSGTGLLANALEKEKPNQSVLRIDGSKKMLEQHRPRQNTKVFDLNYGLPPFDLAPTLIASNFALHWLEKPEDKLKEWFSILAPKGLLAISLPVKGSFPEWYQAAFKANVKCTAMQFPSHESLRNIFQEKNIQFHQLENFIQEASTVNNLLKSLVDVGGKSTPYTSLTVGEWRKIQKSWVISPKNHLRTLTWSIFIMLVRK